MIDSDTLDEILDLASDGDSAAIRKELDNLSKEDIKVVLETFVYDYFDMVTCGNPDEDEYSAKQKEVTDYFESKDNDIIAQWMAGEHIEGAPELEDFQEEEE